jgi:hypothetical protein
LIGAQKDTDNKVLRGFRHWAFHRSLAVINKTLEPYMCDWDIIWCSDHHFWHAIYGLGLYIADYPEQTAAAGMVYNWCVMWAWVSICCGHTNLSDSCDAKPTDLNNPDASLCTREKTAALLDNEDSESLWYNHGIIPDLHVCFLNVDSSMALSSQTHLRHSQW